MKRRACRTANITHMPLSLSLSLFERKSGFYCRRLYVVPFAVVDFSVVQLLVFVWFGIVIVWNDCIMDVLFISFLRCHKRVVFPKRKSKRNQEEVVIANIAFTFPTKTTTTTIRFWLTCDRFRPSCTTQRRKS